MTDAHRNHGSNDTQEGRRVEEETIKVDLEGRVQEEMIRVVLSSDSSSTEDPTPPSIKDCEVYQQQLLPPTIESSAL